MMREHDEQEGVGKESESGTSEVFGIEQFTGRSIDDVIVATIDALEKDATSEKRRRSLKEKLHLAEGEPLRAALNRAVRAEASEYVLSVDSANKRISEQSEHCRSMVLEHGWQDNPKTVRILVSDPTLHRGVQELLEVKSINSYDPESDIVLVGRDQPNRLVAHEVGHALSANADRIGFLRRKKLEKGTVIKGNVWFNEGCTVLWEEKSVNDDSRIESRFEQSDMYGWARDAIHLVMREAQINEDVLLSAYFGSQESLQIVEKKIQERFGCSVDEMECLSVRLDVTVTEEILTGQKVKIEVPKSRQPNARRSYDQVASLFPNVQLIEPRGSARG